MGTVLTPENPDGTAGNGFGRLSRNLQLGIIRLTAAWLLRLVTVPLMWVPGICKLRVLLFDVALCT